MSVSVFLSTVSDEFRDYRDRLRSDLTRHNVEVKVQEDFKDYGSVTLDKLDLYIRYCDAVVHLVGDMTGANAKPASTNAILAKYPDITEKLPPLKEVLKNGLGISYTQWEAWLALYHGKVLLIAKADVAAPRGADYAPTDVSRAAQRAHLERLERIEHFPGYYFTSSDNLASHIAYTTILDLLAEDRAKEAPRDSHGIPYAAIIGALLLLVVTPLVAEQLTRMFGLTLGAATTLIGGVGGLALALMFWRYVEILGASTAPARSAERQTYDALRATIAAGGWPVWLYSRWLTKFLDAVDRFFGDAGMAHRTLFPRAFGLKAPAPLWTAAAFDRCLLLSLLYPILVILFIWTVSGHSGPAENSLGLGPDRSGLQRGIVVGLGSTILLPLWLAIRAWKKQTPWSFLAAFLAYVACNTIIFAISHFADLSSDGGVFGVVGAFAVPAVFLLAVAPNSAGVASVSGTMVGTLAFASTFVLARMFGHIIWGMGAKIFGTSVVSTAFTVGVVVFTLAAFLGGAFAAIAFNGAATTRRRQGLFLLVFLFLMVLISFGEATVLSSMLIWRAMGPAALFLGLLTLINAPFDWASIGLTRALLRRGLELGGWWPYFLALADAFLAAVFIAILALTTVLSVQAFDHLVTQGGAPSILHVKDLIDGIESHPEAPEYWWIYALLLSTMIPSLINLVIGGTALMRTVPGLPSLLLNKIPAIGGVLAFDRTWLALLLTLQVAVGVVLALPRRRS